MHDRLHYQQNDRIRAYHYDNRNSFVHSGIYISSEGKYLKELAEGLEKYTSLLEKKEGLCDEIFKLVKTENKKEENENGKL